MEWCKKGWSDAKVGVIQKGFSMQNEGGEMQKIWGSTKRLQSWKKKNVGMQKI